MATWLRSAASIALAFCLAGCQEDKTAPPVSPSVVAEELEAIEARLLSCIDDESLGRTAPLKACNDKAIDAHAALLDDVLAARRAEASVREEQTLGRAQLAWRESIVRTCENDPDYREFGGDTLYPGTFAQVIYSSCISRAYEQRIKMLVGLKL